MNCPPILLLVFNRPILAKRIFNQIREARPKQLFVAADGPRNDRLGEPELCAEARGIVKQVDWSCEVKTLFREHNLGCKNAVSEAISWFFTHVDEGIILEDDCLPTLDFFRFCEELLPKYRNDSRIGMISGNNFGFDLYDEALSYSFSKHGFIWGWATWKRCWEKYNNGMDFMNATNIDLIKANISTNVDFVDCWWKGVNTVLHEDPDSIWDSQWGVTRYANNYLTIRPKVNLVANIGFGEDATHTTGKSKINYSTTSRLEFPLVHPGIVVPDRVADNMLEEFFLPHQRKLSIFARVKKWIKGKIVGSVIFRKLA